MDNSVPGQLVSSKPLGKLAAALAKAQKAVQTPKKTRDVDYTDKQGRRIKYKYADLNDCIDALKEPLAANALSYTQTMGNDPVLGFGLFTTLMHESGEFETSFYPLPDPEKMRPQEFGSAITYARRYSLSSITGIASEEDDDGAAASDNEPPGKRENKAQQPQGRASAINTKAGPHLKNHAPGGQQKPENKAPTDPFPPDDGPKQKALQDFYQLCNDSNINQKRGKELVEMVLGKTVKFADMTIEQIEKVSAFIKQMP